MKVVFILDLFPPFKKPVKETPPAPFSLSPKLLHIVSPAYANKPIHCHAACPKYTHTFLHLQNKWVHMGSVFINKVPIPGSAPVMKKLGCPQPAGSPWPVSHRALELNLVKISSLLQPALRDTGSTKHRRGSSKFDPMTSFPCNKGSPLDKHLWDGLGRNRLDFSAILVLQNDAPQHQCPFCNDFLGIWSRGPQWEPRTTYMWFQ